MNSGKSTQLLQVAYNYEERHQKVWVIKPSIDNREGADIIKPRIGLERRVDWLINPNSNIKEIVELCQKPDCILVDEAQFLTKDQIWQLTEVVDRLNVPVICYGIRADAFGDLFPGSSQLMAVADTIEELKTICWCGKKAIINARIRDGHVVYSGEQVCVGGNDQYISLCRNHWRMDQIKP
jgi:thymidine kinase